MNEIYFDIGPTGSRVAVIEDGELSEIHIEPQNREKISGNIYKGIVENVLPGMQAAFINIGIDRNAFLYIKDAVDYGAKDIEKFGENISISKILKSGDEILVQISKEPVGSKGARVTTHIAIPGRYMVLMPLVDYIGISRRIEDDNERERLRNIAAKIKPSEMGIIVRTEAKGKNENDFVEDLRFQIALWEKIVGEAKKVRAPRLIHKDLDLIYRTIRDLVNRDTKRVVINEKNAYNEALEIISKLSPDKRNIVEYYDGSINILDHYGVENRIENALSRKVWLKSGGYIIIDQTEALTVIDVNTGKFTGSSSLEDTVLLTNIEAAKEIARQLRLRDIGGIIVIDFIDMSSENNRNTVVDVLRNEFKKDRTKSSVFGITQLGLVEMTRKKVGKRLSSIIQKTCPLCDGSGRVLDEDTILRSIGHKLEQVFKETEVPAVLVEVNEAVKSYLDEEGSYYIEHLEKVYNKRIITKGSYNIEYSDIKVRYLLGDADIDSALNPFREGDRVGISLAKKGQYNTSMRLSEFDGRIEEIIKDVNDDEYKLVVKVNK